MIECKHSWPMFVTNRGLQTNFCVLLGKQVNDDICSNCKHRTGETPKEVLQLDMDFPSRDPAEIEVIYDICKGCPLHDAINKTCKKTPYEMYPTDIVAQHPYNHCPEDKW